MVVNSFMISVEEVNIIEDTEDVESLLVNTNPLDDDSEEYHDAKKFLS